MNPLTRNAQCSVIFITLFANNIFVNGMYINIYFFNYYCFNSQFDDKIVNICNLLLDRIRFAGSLTRSVMNHWGVVTSSCDD